MAVKKKNLSKTEQMGNIPQVPEEMKKLVSIVPKTAISQAPPTSAIPPTNQQTWQLGNQIFTNKEEYNAAVSAARISEAPTGGIITPKAAQAVKEAKAARIKYTPELLSAFEKRQLIEEKAAETPEETEIPPIETLLAKAGVEEAVKKSRKGELLKKSFWGKATLSEEVELGIGIGKEFVSTAAEVLDILHTAITRKEPLKRVKAKEAFKASTDIILRNIDNVKAGNPYPDARRNFDDAVAAMHQLEAAATGLGKINLDWWIDEGIGVQADIINELSLLEDLRAELEEARQQGKLLNLKTQYGI